MGQNFFSSETRGFFDFTRTRDFFPAPLIITQNKIIKRSSNIFVPISFQLLSKFCSEACERITQLRHKCRSHSFHNFRYFPMLKLNPWILFVYQHYHFRQKSLILLTIQNLRLKLTSHPKENLKSVLCNVAFLHFYGFFYRNQTRNWNILSTD